MVCDEAIDNLNRCSIKFLCGIPLKVGINFHTADPSSAIFLSGSKSTVPGCGWLTYWVMRLEKWDQLYLLKRWLERIWEWWFHGSMTNSQSLNNRSKAFANTVGFLWFSQPLVWGEGKNKKQLCLPLCGWRWLPLIHMMLPDPLHLKESFTVLISIIHIHHHSEFANGIRGFLLSRRANCRVSFQHQAEESQHKGGLLET